MRIGLVGYGRMGAAMSARIASQGHELVVWNRSSAGAQAAAEAGATLAESPAALVSQCDVAMSSLFDEAAVRSVYLGPAGLAQGALGGRLVIDTSTVPPEMGAVLAQAIAGAGGRFVDSPVVGTIGPAREGRLVALCGGAPADIAAARETLALVSRAIHPMGPSGAGYAGKLAVNLLKATYWAALGDCLGLGRRYGIEPDAILDVIESGPGALVELPAKMPVLRGAQTKAAFDIVGVVKDLGGRRR
jgi:3-hydroxyisobutyrate dehydrogenase